ncbi:MAG: glycosyltransferase family 2 protein [Thermoguttaceae bacterium]
MVKKALTALPVFNEAAHVAVVLDQVRRYSQEVLVVDDGSTDDTSALLGARGDIHLVTHTQNLGYGAALISAFDFALRGGYEVLVTIDCDGQHEPRCIPHFVQKCREEGADIVSGSRYLKPLSAGTRPPADRRRINEIITRELNAELGLRLTDSFCGFKAYRVPVLDKFELSETGYAMPLELWVQAAALGLKIIELPVPLVYLEEARSFGGSLDNAEIRLGVYREVLRRSMEQVRAKMVGEQGTGTFCAKHLKGRSGKRCLSPFPGSSGDPLTSDEAVCDGVQNP